MNRLQPNMRFIFCGGKPIEASEQYRTLPFPVEDYRKYVDQLEQEYMRVKGELETTRQQRDELYWECRNYLKDMAREKKEKTWERARIYLEKGCDCKDPYESEDDVDEHGYHPAYDDYFGHVFECKKHEKKEVASYDFYKSVVEGVPPPSTKDVFRNNNNFGIAISQDVINNILIPYLHDPMRLPDVAGYTGEGVFK